MFTSAFLIPPCKAFIRHFDLFICMARFPHFININMDNTSELARKTFKHRMACLSLVVAIYSFEIVLIRIFIVQILKLKHSQGNWEVSNTNPSIKTMSQISNIINIRY